jgi:hypothetical protein
MRDLYLNQLSILIKKCAKGIDDIISDIVIDPEKQRKIKDAIDNIIFIAEVISDHCQKEERK